jgi:copper chaperone
MTCGGCSGAVDRVLKKTEGKSSQCRTQPAAEYDYKGVNSYDISLETQLVNVTGTIPYDDLLTKIKKTGKEVRSGIIAFRLLNLALF